MPSSAISPHKPHSRNRALERQTLARTIDLLGSYPMAPCTNCARKGQLCVLLKGNARCGNCTRKNMGCDGQFSEEEFDNLERKKLNLRKRVEEQRQRLAELAQEILRTQSSLGAAEREIEGITRSQSDMVVRHSWVLDALDREEGYSPDEPEPSASGVSSGVVLAFDDEQLEALLSVDTTQGAPFLFAAASPGKGAYLVPRNFPSHRTLTI